MLVIVDKSFDQTVLCSGEGARIRRGQSSGHGQSQSPTHDGAEPLITSGGFCEGQGQEKLDFDTVDAWF